MPVAESYDETLDESYDESLDESYDEDDESFDEGDDESEFLPGLLGLPDPMFNLFRGSTPARAPLPRTSTPVGGGVSTAMLNTPQGRATIQLSQSVVSKQQFDAAVQSLRTGINRNTDRLNTVQKDVTGLSTRLTSTTALVERQRRDLRKVRTEVTRARRQNRAAIAKLRRNVQDQAMTSMMMSLMAQQSLGDQLARHTHPANDKPSDNITTDGKSMMIPLLLMTTMNQDGGGANNMMLPIVMLMAFSN
ncbi:MAG TPA: hypothetical protein VGX25_02045 [Actinophytocola sp.]|uniref:hypothetical protein n=1 Tax=Actinophytocola sp. TaxID=1872138 RepID=UPI002DDC9EEE|nr:hypothetical protein [Actinophytocola sp.]HEV2778160.1 hypothetical protein [Actinophytocola sp.]